ncbi:MAG: response regulator [Oscillatoriaceae bacterium SKYG93]|nr:response regulator [Oscillatoriaceae bacterium SKYG93]MDW8453108.1 response regulator [Oscillatoriaceae cyanobacterium SKYGB_i_bin93]
MLTEQQERIKALFIEEAKEHLATIEQGLLQLPSTLEDSEKINELFRAAHSIKGGAAMLGIDSIQKVANRLEDYFKIFKEYSVEVDQNLEKLLLRVFEGLQKLTKHLQEAGLYEQVVAAIMAEIEPVFEEISERIKIQERNSKFDAVTAINAGSEKNKVASIITEEEREESAFKLIFNSDVNAMLREMLQVLKQPAVSRKKLQEICRKLMQAGEQFELRNWCELIEMVGKAIANPENNHQALTLAVREIKKAQELVLAGKETTIVPSNQLKNLLPQKNSQSEQLLHYSASYLSSSDITTLTHMDTKPKQPQKKNTQPSYKGSRNEQLKASAANFDDLTETSTFSQSQKMDFNSKRNEHSGPEVGIAELNSLADLFEGEAPLDTTWETEEVLEQLDSEIGMANKSGKITAAETDANLELPNDFSDLLFDDNNGDTSTQIDSELDDLNSLFGDALIDEEEFISSLSSETSNPVGSAENEENTFSKFRAGGLAYEQSSNEDNLSAFADESDIDKLFAELEEKEAKLDLLEKTANDSDNLEAALFGEDKNTTAVLEEVEPKKAIASSDTATDLDEWAALWASSEASEELVIDTTDTSLESELESLFESKNTAKYRADRATKNETEDELKDLLEIGDSQHSMPQSNTAEEFLELADSSNGDFEELFTSIEADVSQNLATPPPQSQIPTSSEKFSTTSWESKSDELEDLLENFFDDEAAGNLPSETKESENLLSFEDSEFFAQLGKALADTEDFNLSEPTADSSEAGGLDEIFLSAETSSDELELLLETAEEAAQNRELSELEALFDAHADSTTDTPDLANWSAPPTEELKIDFDSESNRESQQASSTDELSELFGSAETKSEVKESLEFLESLFDSSEQGKVSSDKSLAKSQKPEIKDGKKLSHKWAEELEALLEEKPGYALSGQYGNETEIFAELEALLVQPVAGAQSVLKAEPQSTKVSEKHYEDSDFDELEELIRRSEAMSGGGGQKIRPGIATGKARPKPLDQTMRVPIKQLDNLSNLVGELVVNRNSLEQDQERLRQFLDNLLHQVAQLSDVGQRMQDLYERSLLEIALLTSRQNREMGRYGGNHESNFANLDALEMDRFTGFHILSQEIIELIVRVRESASDIEFLVDEAEQVTRQLRQITTQLQEGLTRARMVSFAQTTDRLYRSVRDVAMKEGKQAELQVEGRDVQIDKMIADLLFTPLNHLVNNAIAHGIETPEQRIAAGKPPVGRLTIRAFHQGNQTVISFSDDGAGIDPERVKAKAIEKGLITPERAKNMSRQEVYDLLFEPNFSTKDQANDIAGRGVGLNAVLEKINEIRGVITTDSTPGKGTTFTIRLPLMLSISKALVCISDRARIAFPMDGVEDMLDVPKDRLQTTPDGQMCIPWRDTVLPFRHLRELLTYNRHLGRGNVYGSNAEDDVISVVVLRSAGNYLALQVDQVLGEQEIVIKQLEGPVPKPVGIAGATVMGDGRIVAIADVLELIDLAAGRLRRESGGAFWDEGTGSAPTEPLPEKSEPTVLIVDDSITVRELLSMTFNKAGYRVEQARDGQEAWEKLRSGLPCDIVFCDIEMPRMDGLELLSRMQKDPQLCKLPIAMLTSRGADRHRQMAVQLGARGYFTKPYLEEALLEAASRMLKGEVLVTAKVET